MSRKKRITVVDPRQMEGRVGSGLASRLIGCHPHTLRKWAKTGKIDAVRTAGGQFRYDVAAYLVAHKVQLASVSVGLPA